MKWGTEVNNRQMPWKGEKDPYKIWLSEIILQQTRVEQGLNYYKNFINRYKSICQLAHAKDEEVFKLWEGLGYYTRCRNLLATARKICLELKGKFPNQYSDIVKLKGVGPYTAAAIASFAYNLPHAVVDGNVMRVLARFFGIDIAIDSPSGKKTFASLAQTLLDTANPAIYNQSIMDFGATVCTPAKPQCISCPLNTKCYAFSKQKVQLLPVKEKTLAKKNRWFYYIIAEWRGKFYIRKRTAKDIWHGLHEFYLIEPKKEINILNNRQFTELGEEVFTVLSVSEKYIQLLTHQKISTVFIRIKYGRRPKFSQHYQPLSLQEIEKLAFPKTIKIYLEKYLFA